MNLLQKQLAKIPLVCQQFDTDSLRVRLTAGIALVSALGLGSLAIWISIRMQQILVATHKENIHYISDRFPQDVKIYSDMVSLQEGTEKAIDNLTTGNRLLWVKNPSGKLTAQSDALLIGEINKSLILLTDIPSIPELKNLNGRYWLLCATPLKVKNTNLGTLYIAQDITDDQAMLLSLIRSLSIATIAAIALITIAIAYYINHSVRPLKKISQLTAKISADKLTDVHIQLENAPREVKELAETFEEMLVRLSEAWEHQRQLLSNVSHELRTPLTIISGYLQSTLRRGTNLTEIQREALTIAASEADRTVQLLQDLLDIARADSGRMHFQLELIILNDLIEEVASIAKQYSNRLIQVESPQEIITIKIDINRLKQILLNLIDNAVKYSDEDKAITLKIVQEENSVMIQVCDRGVGIPLTQQTRIFERFYRLDETRNRSGGMGLGLSIVKTLVEGMGGSVSVRSQLQQGTTFTILFPLLRA